MPRCTSTNQFASYDDPEVDDPQGEINGSTYTAEVRVVRPCAECGEEMAEYTFELEAEVACPNCGELCGGHYGTHRDLPPGVLPSDKLPNDHEDYDEHEPELEITDETADFTERSGPTTRTTKSGKVTHISPRYVKTFLGVHVDVEIHCTCCDDTYEAEAEDDVQASYFEVLV